MKKPSLKLSGMSSWIKVRKQKSKEKEEQELQNETHALRMSTFVVTLIAMALGMSYLPLFPQPLPILLAVLVAFATYQKPRFGMPVGGALLGLGLMFHLGRVIFHLIPRRHTRGVSFIVIGCRFCSYALLFNRHQSAWQLILSFWLL